MQVGLSKREAGLIWALLGRGEGQTHMTTLIILRWQVGTSRSLSLKMSLKTTKPFEKKQPWWLMIWIQISMQGLIFFHWVLLGKGEWFCSAVTGWLVDLGKKLPKRATNLKKKQGWSIEKRWCLWKRFHLVTLGPPQQGVVPNTHDNSDFFSSDRLEPPANWFGGEKVAKKGRKSGKNAKMIIWKQKVVPLRERGSILWHWALLGRGRAKHT